VVEGMSNVSRLTEEERDYLLEEDLEGQSSEVDLN
jgi:hypothetical protein